MIFHRIHTRFYNTLSTVDWFVRLLITSFFGLFGCLLNIFDLLISRRTFLPVFSSILLPLPNGFLPNGFKPNG